MGAFNKNGEAHVPNKCRNGRLAAQRSRRAAQPHVAEAPATDSALLQLTIDELEKQNKSLRNEVARLGVAGLKPGEGISMTEVFKMREEIMELKAKLAMSSGAVLEAKCNAQAKEIMLLRDEVARLKA